MLYSDVLMYLCCLILLTEMSDNWPWPKRNAPYRVGGDAGSTPYQQQGSLREPNPVSHIPSESSDLQDYWSCKHCTFHNPLTSNVCQVCDRTSWIDTKKPDPAFEVISKLFWFALHCSVLFCSVLFLSSVLFCSLLIFCSVVFLFSPSSLLL